MRSFNPLISLFTFFLFTAAAFGSPLPTDDTTVSVLGVGEDEYVKVFGRGLPGNVCGSQLKTLSNQISVDIATIAKSFDHIIADITTATSCSCKLEGDIVANLQAVNKLIIDLVASIATINWSCVTISICFQLGNVIITLIEKIIAFLLCVLTYVVRVNVEIDAAIWTIIFNIPNVLLQLLEQICGAVLIFKLIAWTVILNLKAVISTLVPHCGCQV